MADTSNVANASRRSKRRSSQSSISGVNARRSKPGSSQSKRRASLKPSEEIQSEVNILKLTWPNDGPASSAIDETDEIVQENHCPACERDGRKKQSTHFCVECEENLCIDCVQQHRKFAAMKDHNVRPLSGRRRGRAMMENPVKCGIHDNKVMDMYCGDCDNVFCAACIAMNHRQCKDAVYLPIVAKDIAKSKEFFTIYENVAKTKAEIETLKQRRKEDMVRLLKEREDAAVRVKYIRTQVDAYLENLEKLTLEKLQVEFDNFRKMIEKDLTNLEDILQQLYDLSHQFTDANTMDESHLFIQLRKATNTVEEGNKTHGRLSEEVGKEQIQFIPDSRLMEMIQNYPSLGHFASEQRLFNANYLGHYDVHQGRDVSDCQLMSCAVLPDGKVLLTDWDNKSVKLLNNAYKIIDSFNAQSPPYGICVINQHEAVASLTNRKALQYLSIDSRQKIIQGKTLRINEFCRDVAFYDESLYVVTCAYKDGGKCQVKVYDTDGQLLRGISTGDDEQDIFKRAQYLTVNSIGGTIVSDENVGVLTINDEGVVTSTFSDKKLKYPYGVTVTTNDQILVCGFGSHNIVQVGRNGVLLGELLTDAAGLKNPRSIAYDVHRQRIVVTCKHSNIIRVFKLL